MKAQSTDGRTVVIVDKKPDPDSQSEFLIAEDGELFRPAPYGVGVVPVEPKPNLPERSSEKDAVPVIETPEEVAARQAEEARLLAEAEAAPEPEPDVPATDGAAEADADTADEGAAA